MEEHEERWREKNCQVRQRKSEAVSAIEGFGILSLASICPIVAVLTMGLVIQMTQKTKVTQES